MGLTAAEQAIITRVESQLAELKDMSFTFEQIQCIREMLSGWNEDKSDEKIEQEASALAGAMENEPDKFDKVMAITQATYELENNAEADAALLKMITEAFKDIADQQASKRSRP